MKLARVGKPPCSVQMRVMLGGDLNASLERYARYYEQVHGESVDARALIPGRLRAFLEVTESSSRGRAPVATASAPHPSSLLIPGQHQGRKGDWLQRKVG
jgi:hypothetical protein